MKKVFVKVASLAVLMAAVSAVSVYGFSFGDIKDKITGKGKDDKPEEIAATAAGDFVYALTKDGSGVLIKGINGKEPDTVMKIAIPDKIEEVPVVSIAEGAFSKCAALEKVTLPQQLVEVGNKAFFGCASLVSVVFPNEVDQVGDSAFEGCTSLESITLPKRDKMKKIGSKAFKGCASLSSVTVPGKLQKIGGRLLGGIEDNAFVGCSSIPLKDQAALKQLGYKGKF